MSLKISGPSGVRFGGVTVENEPIIKSDGAGEVMQWQPSDGAADGIFITENSAGNPLRMGVGVTPSDNLHVAGNSAVRNTIVSNVTLDGGTSAANPYEGFGFGVNLIGRDYGDAVRNYASIYTLMEAKTSSSGGGDAGFKAGLAFYTNSGGASGTNPTEKLRISSAGAVIINNAGGDAQIYLGGSSGTSRMYLSRGGANASLWNVDAGSLRFGTNDIERLSISSAGLASFSGGIKIDAGTIQLDDVAESIDFLQSGAINFDSNNDQTGRTLTIGSGRAGGVSGGTTHLTISEATGVTEIAKVVETNGVLKENLLTNSGFDVWSNSTLEDVGSELTTTFTNQNFNTVPGSNAWNGAFVNSAASWGVGQQYVSLTAGKLYKLSFDASSVSGVAVTFGTASSTSGHNLVGVTVTAASGLSYVFEASATTTYLMLHTSSADAAGFTLANVSLKEVTPGCVAADLKAPDRWSKSSTLDLTRIGFNTANIKGMYGCLMTTGSTNAEEIHQPAYPQRGEQSWYNKFRGRTVTFGCWLYADSDASNGAQVYIRDQDGYSYATKVAANTLTWVEVTRTVSTTAWSSIGQFLTVGILYGCAIAAKNCYVSQPMLVFGSAIGAGNYSRPSGEIVWCETSIPSNKFNGVSGFSDTAATILNTEADSNGKIPKGAKAISVQMFGRDAVSSTNQCNVLLGGTINTQAVACTASGAPNDVNVQSTGWTPCDANGDYYYLINASGTGTWDFYNNYTYQAVQLR